MSEMNTKGELCRQTEIGEIPESWEVVQLKEIANLRRENANPQDSLSLSYVGLEHIDSGESLLKRWGEASEVTSAKSHFYFNDVLYGKLRAYLDKVVIAEMEGICSTDILVVTANSKTIPRFLVYLLHTHLLISHAVATSTGVNHPRTSWNSLGKFTFALPPLPEQRAIAHVLQTIQEAKSTRQRELALERERKAALMDYLFSHGTKGEPCKRTEIGEIPESWEVVELGNYSELITKGSSPKWQGFDYCAEGIFFVRSQNVGLGRLELSEVAYLPKEFNQKEKKSVLQKNDLLINIVGASIGRAAVANDIVEGGNVNQAVAIARLKQGVEPFFVMTFLLTLGGQFQLHKQKKDIARANLSLQDIKNLLIPLPSFSEQAEIAEILNACDTKIAALEQETARLEELFHAMLDELMTGQRSTAPLLESEMIQ